MRAGDLAYYTGKLFTARDEATKKLLSLSEQEKRRIPSLSGAAIFHCGPVVKKTGGKWEAVSAGPTTSARMNALAPEFLEKYSPSLIIGKGGMDGATLGALQKHGSAYLSFVGGCGALAAKRLAPKRVWWLKELGMPEALWEFDAKGFGPLIVSMDCHGKNLYA